MDLVADDSEMCHFQDDQKYVENHQRADQLSR